MSSGSLIQDTTSIWKETHNDGNFDWMSEQDRVITIEEGGSLTSTSNADTEDIERNDPECDQLKQTDDENEFGDTGLEELVKSEGPQEILQLIIQEQADDFMKEEITDSDDYAD
jgi:hypothetical protein